MVVKHIVRKREVRLCVALHDYRAILTIHLSNKSPSRHPCQNQAGTPHLQSNVQVQKANGAPLSQLVLLLCATHLHNAERLRLCGQRLHAQGLQTVLGETGQRDDASEQGLARQDSGFI